MLFTSLKAEIDHSVQGPMEITFFRMSGGWVNRISSIKPARNEDAGYSQIFVVGDRGTQEANLQITKA
jgi:hypothetical protein